MENLSKTEQYILAIVPCFSGGLSFACSGLIISQVCGGNVLFKIGVKSVWANLRVYDRLMFSLSCADIVHSFWLVVSQLPMPKGTPGTIFARGNSVTCSVQGFFILYGLISRLWYHAGLCIFFVRSIKHRCANHQDLWFYHIVQRGVNILALATAVIPFLTSGYGNKNESNSLWCTGYDVHNTLLKTITNLQIFLAIIVCFYATVAVDLFARKLPISKETGLISFCFFSSLIVTSIWSTNGMPHTTWIFFAEAILYPLMGFLNYLVYNYRKSVGEKVKRRLSIKTEGAVDVHGSFKNDNKQAVSSSTVGRGNGDGGSASNVCNNVGNMVAALDEIDANIIKKHEMVQEDENDDDEAKEEEEDDDSYGPTRV